MYCCHSKSALKKVSLYKPAFVEYYFKSSAKLKSFQNRVQ